MYQWDARTEGDQGQVLNQIIVNKLAIASRQFTLKHVYMHEIMLLTKTHSGLCMAMTFVSPP